MSSIQETRMADQTATFKPAAQFADKGRWWNGAITCLIHLSADPRQRYRAITAQISERLRYGSPGAGRSFPLEFRPPVTGQKTPAAPPVERIPYLSVEIAADEPVREIQLLMSAGQYEEAKVFARKVRPQLASLALDASPYVCLALAEFDKIDGLAHIYTREVARGKALTQAVITTLEGGQTPEQVAHRYDPHSPEGKRRSYILGRAYNNLGYADYTELGHYELALQEFEKAKFYFRASDLREEDANSSDNMGRVFTLLYRRQQARQWLDQAQEQRQQSGYGYRLALSLNSQAIQCLHFDEPREAYKLGREALVICEARQQLRGIGLASLTLAGALRQLAGRAGSLYGAIKNLERAENHLKRAAAIFEQSVQEPLRLAQMNYELGCVYSDRAGLFSRQGRDGGQIAMVDDQAIDHLGRVISMANQNPALYGNTCLALAQHDLQFQRFGDAEFWLRQAERVIPGFRRYSPETPELARPCRLVQRLFKYGQAGDLACVKTQALPAIAFRDELTNTGVARTLDQVLSVG